MRAFNRSAKRRRAMQPALEQCEGRILLSSYHTGGVNVGPALVVDPMFGTGRAASMASPSLAPTRVFYLGNVI
jgi:hypothetical protein